MERTSDDRRMLLTAAGIGLGVACFLYVRSGRARQVFEVQRELWIDAPVDEVFRFWRHLENLPRVMPDVLGVEDKGDGHSHWSVRGPAGLSLGWDATTTHVAPNRAISWCSERGSAIEHAGRVRFEQENGGTRIDVRMSWRPPIGAIGGIAARLLGVDPAARIDDDLQQLKRLLETGETTTRGRTVTREEMQPEFGVQGV